MINRKYNTTLRHISKEDEDDGIEVEVTEYPYFDDNLDFVGSTDNVVDTKTGRFIAVIDFNADGEGRIRECPHCLEYEIHNRLGRKIKKKGEAQHQMMINSYHVMNVAIRFQYMKRLPNPR